MQTNPFSKYDPKVLKTVREFRLLDDNFMVKVFEDKKCVEFILRIIMGVPSLVVQTNRVQDSVNNLQGKSVRYDISATDADGTLYNIEVQRASTGAISKRARYNSAMLDANVTDPGDQYKLLPKTYVIFITEEDVLGKGQLCYYVDRMYYDDKEEKYVPFDDDAHIIYVNAAYKDVSTELGKLMSDFRVRDPDKMYFPLLKERVKLFKEEPKGVSIMCKAVEELQNETRVDTILMLLETGEVTLDCACRVLDKTPDEIQALLEERQADKSRETNV